MEHFTDEELAMLWQAAYEMRANLKGWYDEEARRQEQKTLSTLDALLQKINHFEAERTDRRLTAGARR